MPPLEPAYGVSITITGDDSEAITILDNLVWDEDLDHVLDEDLNLVFQD